MNKELKIIDTHGILFDSSKYLEFSNILKSRHGKEAYNINFITTYLKEHKFPTIDINE